MPNNYYLMLLIFLTLTISLFYFYLFAKTKESYIRYWGFSWTTYTLSLLLDIFLFAHMNFNTIIGLKQMCDLLSSLFLLFGTYVFMNKKIPSHWIQYSLVILIWLITSVYYRLPFIAITLLPSIYLSSIAIVMGVILLRYWEINKVQKLITGTIFFLWGIHKAYYPYMSPQYMSAPMEYLSEIILANILNFCILVIYLQNIRKELSRSENRFRLLAENAQDLIYFYRLTPSPIFEYVSPSSINITGYSPEEFYSDPSFFVELAHPKEHFVPDTSSSSKSEPVIIRWLHKDGHYVWTEQRYTLIYDGQGSICAIEGILRDITDRKLAEDKMHQAKKSRQLFLTYISHELRTPITSILGYVTALLDGTISQSESKEHFLQLIHSKSMLLHRLIEDLFQLTQLESKQFAFNFSQISIIELLNEISKKYEWDVRRAGINLHLFIDSIDDIASIDVIVDIERIDQVMSNLIFNALKNTPSGGKITICCEKHNVNQNSILIKVKDTGKGISEEELPFVFDRFYKGKKSDNSSSNGMGLGLAISKEIILSHKGEIWVESAVNQGSAFCFTLPVYEEYSDN